MLILSFDLETTGLDKHEDRMIEVGLVLYSTGQNRVLESTGFLVQSDGVTVAEEITKITGITQAAVDKFGYDPGDALDDIIRFWEQADIIATHNGIRFDIPFTRNTAKRLNRLLPEKIVVDTMIDLPGTEGQKLITMCAEHGFVNAIHSAEDDAKSVLKLMSYYDINAIVARAQEPTVVVISGAPRTPTNAENKKFKFRWSPENKFWWKLIKESDIEGLRKKFPYDLSIAGKEVDVERLLE